MIQKPTSRHSCTEAVWDAYWDQEAEAGRNHNLPLTPGFRFRDRAMPDSTEPRIAQAFLTGGRV